MWLKQSTVLQWIGHYLYSQQHCVLLSLGKGDITPTIEQEWKGMSSAASPPHFFISPCPYLVSTFELRARKRTISFNKKSATAVG